MTKMKKIINALAFAMLVIVGVALSSSCSKEEEKNIYEGFPSQNIPSELCGTWFEVMISDDHFVSMTIESDGKISADYYDNYLGQTEHLIGKCYYADKVMMFYHKVGNNWEPYPVGISNHFTDLNIGDNWVVPITEWTSSTLMLVDFNDALFFSRNREMPSSYLGTERPSYMVGGWRHHNITHALDLKQDGTGTRHYVNSAYSITNWFVQGKYFYIKDGGNTHHYEVYEITQSNGAYCLCYVTNSSEWIFQKE